MDRKRAHRPEEIAGRLDREARSQAASVRKHPDEPTLALEAPGLHLVPQDLELGVRGSSAGQGAEQWARPAVDPRLSRRVQLDLAPRILFLDDGPDRRPLLDRDIGPNSPAGQRRLR